MFYVQMNWELNFFGVVKKLVILSGFTVYILELRWTPASDEQRIFYTVPYISTVIVQKSCLLLYVELGISFVLSRISF